MILLFTRRSTDMTTFVQGVDAITEHRRVALVDSELHCRHWDEAAGVSRGSAHDFVTRRGTPGLSFGDPKYDE